MEVYELIPTLTNQQSFYRKAMVRHEDGKKILRSYDTDVAYFKGKKLTILIHPESAAWSGTTNRHLREFAYQNGLGELAKKDLTKFVKR